jgi:phosphatidylserine decarboxylase
MNPPEQIENRLEASGSSPGRTLSLRRLFDESGFAGLNFVLTNRLPRRWLTRWMGRLSRIESRWFTALAIGLWRRFADLDLSEARTQPYHSLRECFIRELKPGARTVDPDPGLLVSPCDAIIGAHGRIEAGQLYQAKGMPYALAELIGDARLAQSLEGGSHVTLRLLSSMYHRFHAPAAGRIERVRHFPGDTWNVNPPALARVDRLYCRNERAVLSMELASNGDTLLLVPVAAILVASMRLHCIDRLLHIDHQGPRSFDCDCPVERGQELGWFEHGSTIIAFTPPGYTLLPGLNSGTRVRMGQGLLKTRVPSASASGQ